MTFNSKTFAKIRENRGLSIADLAKITSISDKTLSGASEGTKIPTKKQIFKLSDMLAVPAYAFFMDDFDVNTPFVIDFRSKNPSALKLGKNTYHFNRIFQLRDFLADLYVRLDLDAPQKLIGEQQDENPEQFAAAISQELKISEIRENSKDKKDFYRKLRDAIESLGVYTVQNHFFSKEIDGFALYHESFSSNLIYVNSSKRNHGAKSFTLAHELAHVLGRRSAISNNYESDNEIERYCNVFATSLLLPRNTVSNFIERRGLKFDSYQNAVSSADVVSKHFKCSVSAALIRAAELQFSRMDYYHTFAKNFGSPDFLDSLKPKGGGGNDDGPEPGIVDLAMLGKRAVSILNESLERKVTSHYEIFKNTGLSKKRIDGLIQISKKQELSV